MAPLPIADWLASLDEMDAALGATLTALDRYQREWAALLAEPAPAAGASGGEAVLDRLTDRLREWDARLAAAADLAGSVEKQLNDGETAVGRWQTLFTGWREVIQRGVEPGGAEAS